MRFILLLLTSVLLSSVLLSSGCARVVTIPGPSPEVVVVNDEDPEDREDYGVARALRVPRGHYPPPGECRLWYPGRPPGQQPPPGRCERFIGRVPAGAFILYNDKAWDSEYDWARYSRRNPGAVPEIIIRLVEPAGRR